MNVAAVMSTTVDSTAVLYDAGLVSKTSPWEKLYWSDTENFMRRSLMLPPRILPVTIAVKYRTIIGQGTGR